MTRFRFLPLFRIWFALVALAVPLGSLAATGDREAFTQLVIEKLQTAMPGRTFVSPASLEIVEKGSEDARIYLDRVYAYVQANPLMREKVATFHAQQIARSMQEQSQPIDRAAVVLVVRHEAKIRQSLSQLPKGEGVGAYPQALAPGLLAIPALNGDASIRYVNDTMLKKLGITETELVKLGAANLAKLQKPFADVAKIPVPHSLGVLHEEFAASRLIDVTAWTDLAKALGGNLVVMPVAYDTVLYGDGSTPTALGALRTLGRQTMQRSETPLSENVYRYAGDRWELVK